MYELVIHDADGSAITYELSDAAMEELRVHDIIERHPDGYYILHTGLSEPWRTIVKVLLNHAEY